MRGTEAGATAPSSTSRNSCSQQQSTSSTAARLPPMPTPLPRTGRRPCPLCAVHCPLCCVCRNLIDGVAAARQEWEADALAAAANRAPGRGRRFRQPRLPQRLKPLEPGVQLGVKSRSPLFDLPFFDMRMVQYDLMHNETGVLSTFFHAFSDGRELRLTKGQKADVRPHASCHAACTQPDHALALCASPNPACVCAVGCVLCAAAASRRRRCCSRCSGPRRPTCATTSSR